MRLNGILLVVLVLSSSLGASAETAPATEESGSTTTPPSFSSDEGDDTEMKERVRAVVLQNKAARQGIESYSMKIAWQRRQFPNTPLDAPLPEGTVVSYGEGIWMEKGEKYHIHRTKRWERSSSEKLGIQPPAMRALEGKEYATWAVHNESYLARYDSKLPGRIYLYPQETLTNRTALVDGERFPEPMKWGFGFGGGYLDVEYEKSLAHDLTRWERVDLETPDGPRIKVTRVMFYKRLNHEVRTDFVVAPEQGFLLTSVVVWNPPGVKEFQTDMTLASAEAGRWYPSRATRRELDCFYEYEFSEVQLNPDVDDKWFTIDAFDLDYGATRLHRQKENGTETRMLFREGQWVLESMVPRNQWPKFPGENVRYSAEELKSLSD